MTTDRAVSDDAVEAALVAHHDGRSNWREHYTPTAIRLREADMRAALRAASPFLAGDGVKVRPLVWASEPPYRVARVLGGHYAIEVYETGVDLTGSFCVRRGLSSFAEAQAAAQQDYESRIMSAPQADYEARIMSTLSAPPPQPEVAGLVEAARDVLAERERQKSVEGWTPEHDDQHRAGELAQAAAAYAYYGTEAENSQPPAEDVFPPSWDAGWWKPTDHRRNLVKAGALILAEIERLDRAALASMDGGK